MISGKQSRRDVSLLILLCWVVYTCSYIGKLNYAANINQVMSYYSITHAEAGLVSTLFFFSYGIGQVVNGIWCKKYNIKWIVFISVAVSGASNLIIAISESFEIIKYLWVINGFSLSILWPCLIRLLSETVSSEGMARASVTMGTTTAAGTFFIYGISAIFAALTDSFKAVFYIAAGIMLAVAIIWLLTVDRRVEAIKATGADDPIKPVEGERSVHGSLPIGGGILLSVCMLAIFGVITNFVKDGLTTWVPSILKESWGLGDSLSIMLTMTLPIVTIFGNLFAVMLHGRIPDFVYQCVTVFLVSGGVIGVLIAVLDSESFVLPLVCFALVCFLVGSCNSLITSIFPLFMKGKVNSGLIAGILNGCCYVGSTISSYGLGAVADASGWRGVFVLLLAVCLGSAIIALVYGILRAVSVGRTK